MCLSVMMVSIASLLFAIHLTERFRPSSSMAFEFFTSLLWNKGLEKKQPYYYNIYTLICVIKTAYHNANS